LKLNWDLGGSHLFAASRRKGDTMALSCFGLPREWCELLRIRNLVRAETTCLSSFIADVFHPHISLKEAMCCLGEVKLVKNGCRWFLSTVAFIHQSSPRREIAFS